jgi:hypothetical protein
MTVCPGVDTLCLLLHTIVHPTEIQDRNGCILRLATLSGMCPFLKKLFVDAGYQGSQFHMALAKIPPAIGNHRDLKQEVTQSHCNILTG